MDIPIGLESIRNTIERPLTADEERTIPNWIDRAWRILQREVPGIPARVDLPDTDPGYLTSEEVGDVLTSMVERKVRNAAGLRSWGGDDYNQVIDSELSSGKIYVTDDEKAALATKPLGSSGGIYSIPLATRP